MKKAEILIKNEEIKECFVLDTDEFPKYTTQILNLANQNAQATRPKYVGQMSDLVQEFSGKTIEEWETWYLEKHPDAIPKAVEKISEMIENFKEAFNKIDKNLIEKWLRDLIIIKTFIGLRFQEAILKKLSKELDKNYRLSTPEEESQGIDGFIDNTPISIKPETYKVKKQLSEIINIKIVYYEKVKNGIKLDYSDLIS